MRVITRDWYRAPNGPNADPRETEVIKNDAIRQMGVMYPGRITSKIFRTEHDAIVVYTRVPSRTKKNLDYDVLIMFEALSQTDFDTSLWELPFRAFSNAPSFYWRFAKAFQSNDMFIDFLVSKYTGDIWEKEAHRYNPDLQIGYERTVYTAMAKLYQSSGIMQPFRAVLRGAIRSNTAQIGRMVKTQSQIESAWASYPDTKRVAKEKKEREAYMNRTKSSVHRANSSPVVKASKYSPKSAKTKRTKFSPKTAKTKRI